MSDTSDKEQPIDTALTTEETSDVQPSDLGQDVQTERNGNSNIQPSVEPSETEEPEIKPDETAVEDFKRGAENEGEADTGDNNDVFDPSLSEQQGDNNEFKEDQKGIQASEQNVDVDDEEEDVYRISNHKLNSEEKEVTKKKKVRKSKKSPVEVNKDEGFVPMNVDGGDNESRIVDETPEARRRRLLEEKMDSAIKTKTVRRRKADEDDIERMQDDRIDLLKDKMIKAANLDVEKNSQGLIATEKLKLLREVTDVLTMADLAISILDNNLLEAVRLWLEPLPDASMPAYQIQKELIFSLTSLPIKTDHLVASGIGKVLVFYQRSKRTEPNLKKVVDRLIGDWTRPILNKSDSYKDRTIQFLDYNRSRFANKSQSSRRNKPKEGKTLYEENAERRRRAAIPSARTTAYSIAPKVDPSLLRRGQNSNGGDERFKRLNQKLTSMNVKKKANKKSGPSIEGRNLPM